ncbi:two-component system response regulator ChvI [Dongia mobilis]|uniref:Two-component system response regulator ChvI n=1 Tax=Dongia mobilis TaxID=578943 RepID=A0A4R6WRR7_9PROT|nr:response regulator transcription factor [Dongia mobilis]TDQ84295.1 two-component system response regulator ChvI [Dongia mobilis]
MAEGTRIVVVDDDDLFRPMLVGNLTEAGFVVREFPAPDQALDALSADSVAADTALDLLILDWKMPGLTGLELLQRLRQIGVMTPAIFLTSLDDVIYEEAALKAGAIDFVGKTRSFAILQRRIELALSRSETGETSESPRDGGDAVVEIGPLTLDAGSHAITWQNQPVSLTLGEFKSVALMVRAGRDVSYREIYDALRGENFAAGQGPDGYRANVRALIKRVRQKFLAVDPGFDAIENFPGFGYRWRTADKDA